MRILTKEEWLTPLREQVSQRNYALLDASYAVLRQNTVHTPTAPWEDVPVISPWSGLLSMAYDDLPRGIFENYDSVSRRGKFNPSVSWSAAFLIEFILQFQEGERPL